MSKTITYNFTDENFDIIYNAFVRQVPMRQILVDGELVDEYSSPEEHLREFAIKAVMKKCNKGWAELAKDEKPADKELIKNILENL